MIKEARGVSDSFSTAFSSGLFMELCGWEGCSIELASHVVDQASADIVSHRVSNEEKLKSLHSVAG